MKRLMLGLIVGSMLVVAGCGTESAAPPAASSVALPADLFATAAPAGAVDIVEAKKAAKDGESIVIKGHIGGSKDPLAANRAIMLVADSSLPTCDKIPGDTCKTPWDSCCEPGDVIAAKTIAVHVDGADGQPLKAGLAGANGIEPKKQVVVAGTIRSVAGALVVDAKQIYVAP